MDEEIYLDGVVGWDITAQSVRESLSQQTGDINFEMNSPGGYITEGVAILNLIRNYKKGKTCANISYAASMMTQIAMACDKVGIYDNGIFMIHNAQGGVYGDHNEQRKQADMQERMSNMLAQAYVKKTGISLEEIKKMMDDNTYLFGQEAVDLGFADFVIPTDQVKDKVVAMAIADEMMAKGLNAVKEEALNSTDLAACLGGCNIEMGATTFKDFPMVDEVWDSTAAINRVREFVGATDTPNTDYRKAFFWYDSESPENFGSYKLPFVDVVDGKLVANIRGVNAANGAMSGARGGVQIPEADRSKVQSHIDKYRNKWKDSSALGASPTAVNGDKSNTTHQGADMAEKTLMQMLQEKLGLGVGKTDAQAVEELEVTLKASNDALDVANTALATKTEAMNALSLKLAEAEQFKAEVNTRLLEAKQTGVSIDVAIAMINAETSEEASKLAIDSKTSTGASAQGGQDVSKEKAEHDFAVQFAKSISVS